MIKLSRFNSKVRQLDEFILNADHIETVESTPDTVITLSNGRKIIVDESMEEVQTRVIEFRRSLYRVD